jgi:predicted FMN-binding regulatory protein PaiB
MYVNPLHQLADREALTSLMAHNPLGAWVCHGREGLIANHVPFFLDRSRGPLGTLIGHVSRANVVLRELGAATSSVVMPSRNSSMRISAMATRYKSLNHDRFIQTQLTTLTRPNADA